MPTPSFKVFSSAGEYVGSCKYASDAAAFVALYGEGATVRFRSHAKAATVWIEGEENFNAADSYDGAAEVITARVNRPSARLLRVAS